MWDEVFDGFYFVPVDESNLDVSFFRVKRDLGKPVGATSIGDMFHVAFFRLGDDDTPRFDVEFEAIFADPKVYVENFIGGRTCGALLRKTEHSDKFWKEYLETLKYECEKKNEK